MTDSPPCPYWADATRSTMLRRERADAPLRPEMLVILNAGAPRGPRLRCWSSPTHNLRSTPSPQGLGPRRSRQTASRAIALGPAKSATPCEPFFCAARGATPGDARGATPWPMSHGCEHTGCEHTRARFVFTEHTQTRFCRHSRRATGCPTGCPHAGDQRHRLSNQPRHCPAGSALLPHSVPNSAPRLRPQSYSAPNTVQPAAQHSYSVPDSLDSGELIFSRYVTSGKPRPSVSASIRTR